MAEKLFRKFLETQISKTSDKKSLAENMKFVSGNTLVEDFDRLYLESRELLHVITKNPSDELSTNITRCLKTNSKFLGNCFNKIESCRGDMADLITDRLTFRSTDNKDPKTEPKPATINRGILNKMMSGI